MVASTARLQQKMQFTKFTDFGQREFYAGMNRHSRAELGAPPTYHVIARMRFQREALLARGVAVHQIRQEVFGRPCCSTCNNAAQADDDASYFNVVMFHS